MIFRFPKKKGFGLLDKKVLVHLIKVQRVATGHFLWSTVSSLGEEGTAVRMFHMANWMAAFVLVNGSALQSLESCCYVSRRWGAEDPHSPAATVVISIRKEARMQMQSLWTLDSIPLSWKRCRKLLWHVLSPVHPPKFPPTPFIGTGLIITSVNTGDGCVPFRGTSADQRAVQAETL